jgi:hypothetical protein
MCRRRKSGGNAMRGKMGKECVFDGCPARRRMARCPYVHKFI